MTLPLIAHAPEDDGQLQESWAWQTDVMVSDNGTEQRVDNCIYPQRTFTESLAFTTIASLRTFINGMFMFGGPFNRPLYAYQTPLTAAATAGDTTLHFNAQRTEIRSGTPAYLYDANGGELVNVNVVSPGSCTILAGISRNYALGSAKLAPITKMMSGNNAAIDRFGVDYAATAMMTFRELTFLAPFVNPLNSQTLMLLAGLPILTMRPSLGGSNGSDQSTDQFVTGIQVFDSGGIVDIRNPWKHAQIASQRNYLCHRVLSPDDWDWWRLFADYCKGSCQPFWAPTWRQDFDLTTAPVSGGATLTFTGTDYASIYFPNAPFRGLMITTAAGIAYATVTSAVVSGGNSAVVFTPALPAGAGWSTVLGVSMLQKSRIADDKVVCYHGGLDTQLQLNIRTIDA